MRFLIAITAALIALPVAAAPPVPDWFQAIDRNQDGVISMDELHNARFQRFAQIDADRDGRLTPRELRADRALLSRFAWFDADRDGQISIGEFETKGMARFAMLDTDGNGRITVNEAVSVARAARNQTAGSEG